MNQKRAHEVAETCRQWENNENWHNTPEMQAAIVLDNRVAELEAENLKSIKANGEVAILHIEAEARAKDLESVIKEMISVDDCQSRIYKQVKRVEKAEVRIRELEAKLEKEKQV